MGPFSLLVLTCLLLILSPALGGEGTDSPPQPIPPPTQPQPTQSSNTTGQCNASYLVQGVLVGPPGRDGQEFFTFSVTMMSYTSQIGLKRLTRNQLLILVVRTTQCLQLYSTEN